MLQTRDAHYSESTRTKISAAERNERESRNLLAEKNQAVREVTKQVDSHREWYETNVRRLLNEQTDSKARQGLAGLLEELTDARGLGWSELARLVGVSVPAVRKWRHGGDISPPRLLALSRLAAFFDLLSRDDIQDPAGWLGVPLAEGGGVTKSDIYAAGGAADLLLYARQELPQRELLARAGVANPGPGRSELIMAEDGHLSIVPTEA